MSMPMSLAQIRTTDVFILKTFNEAVKCIKDKRSTGAKLSVPDLLFLQGEINKSVASLANNGWSERDAKDLLRSAFELT